MEFAANRREMTPADVADQHTAPLNGSGDPSSSVPGQAFDPRQSPNSGPAPQRQSRPGARPTTPHLPLSMILPTMPSTVEETGLELVLLEELTLRHIVLAGSITGGDLAKKLHLPLAGVVEVALASLRRDGLVDVQGAGNPVLGLAGMRLRATERGADIDRKAQQHNGYVGPAPVSLGAFERMLRQQAMSGRSVSRVEVRRGLGHLVLSPDTADRLGAALESGGPILLGGQPGSGKTALANAVSRMYAGGVFVPHSVVIDGQILRVLDPSTHRPAKIDVGSQKLDERWVCCQTPFVRAGVDLTLRDLELHFDSTGHYYDCPLQLKAAGGVLFLDDLGVQATRVEELLARLQEPLTRGLDYLATVDGQQIAFPFTCLLIFASSCEPSTLLSESALRWIPAKINLANPTREQYEELVRRACAVANVEFTQSGCDHLIETHYGRVGRAVRASHPVELVRLVAAAARYFEAPPRLIPQLVDVAADLYFV